MLFVTGFFDIEITGFSTDYGSPIPSQTKAAEEERIYGASKNV
jgi:hypothetical protein